VTSFFPVVLHEITLYLLYLPYIIFSKNKYQVVLSITERRNIMGRRKSTRIPGLSFSWKKALGITQAKQKFARDTGIPTSRAGLERKIGSTLVEALFGRR